MIDTQVTPEKAMVMKFGHVVAQFRRLVWVDDKTILTESHL